MNNGKIVNKDFVKWMKLNGKYFEYVLFSH